MHTSLLGWIYMIRNEPCSGYRTKFCRNVNVLLFWVCRLVTQWDAKLPGYLVLPPPQFGFILTHVHHVFGTICAYWISGWEYLAFNTEIFHSLVFCHRQVSCTEQAMLAFSSPSLFTYFHSWISSVLFVNRIRELWLCDRQSVIFTFVLVLTVCHFSGLDLNTLVCVVFCIIVSIYWFLIAASTLYPLFYT